RPNGGGRKRAVDYRDGRWAQSRQALAAGSPGWRAPLPRARSRIIVPARFANKITVCEGVAAMVDKRKAGTGRSRGPMAKEVATTTAAKEAPASRSVAGRDRSGAAAKHEPAGRAPHPAEGGAPEKDAKTAEKTEKTG